MSILGRVGIVTGRAFSLGHRIVHVCRFELLFLLTVAAVAKTWLLLLKDESTHDSMALVAALTAFCVLEWSVNELLRLLLQHWLMAFDAVFGGKPVLRRSGGQIRACEQKKGGGEENRGSAPRRAHRDDAPALDMNRAIMRTS